MNSDCASVVIDRPAAEVFDFLANVRNLDLWSFGTWQIELLEENLVLGKSMHSGSSAYVRVCAYQEQRLIDFQVGTSVDSMQSRIFARIVPGVEFGANEGSSMLLMIALRTPDMDETRWQGLQDTHAVETGLIKSLIETGYDHRPGSRSGSRSTSRHSSENRPESSSDYHPENSDDAANE